MGVRTVLALVAVVIGPSALAQALPNVPKDEFWDVRLEGGAIQENFARTVATLIDRRLIPIGPVRVGESGTVEKVLLQQLDWPTGIVGASFDILLCSLNPHVCNISAGKARWKLARQPDSPVPQDSDLCSAIMPKDWLCVPKIKVKDYVATQRRAIPKDGSVATLLRENRACPQADGGCSAMVEFLNRGKKDGNSLLVPVGALRIPVPVANERTSEKLKDAIFELRDERDSKRRSPNSIYNVEIFLTRPEQQVRLQQVAPGGDVSDYNTPLQVMSYPDPKAFLTELKNYREQTVLLMDGEIDLMHCFLDINDKVGPSAGSRYKSAIIETTHFSGKTYADLVTRDKECRTVVKNYRNLDRIDHGTHIAGLIAGQISALGLLSVNPRARIWGYNVKPENPKETVYEDINNLLLKTYFPIPVVANLSIDLDVDDQRTTILERIAIGKESAGDDGLANAMLFVMAAGNARYTENLPARKIDLKKDCNLRPACWLHRSTSPNHALISVVALNAAGTGVLMDQQNRPLSNHGIAFDVGAVGEATNAYFGNYFGPMNGTSVAAPYVSGLATLLFAKRQLKTTQPPQAKLVRDRILATSDLTPELAPNVRFGRINFQRALMYENDVFERCSDQKCLTSSVPIRASVANRGKKLVLAFRRDR